jgi:hypothetical protein
VKKLPEKNSILTYQNRVLSGLQKRDMFNGAFEDKEPMLDIRKIGEISRHYPFTNIHIEAYLDLKNR